jgi:hypothetical protein
MSSKWGVGRILAVLPWVIVAVLVGLILLLTQDHWWVKRRDARISYGGHPSEGGAVFVSPDNDVMVSLKEEGDVYVVYRNPEKVGVCDRSTFVVVPYYAYSKHCQVPAVLMNTSKNEQDPNLVLGPGVIEFTSMEGVRVRVSD